MRQRGLQEGAQGRQAEGTDLPLDSRAGRNPEDGMVTRRTASSSASYLATAAHFEPVLDQETCGKHRIDPAAVSVRSYRRRMRAGIAVENPVLLLRVVVVVSRADDCWHAGVEKLDREPVDDERNGEEGE